MLNWAMGTIGGVCRRVEGRGGALCRPNSMDLANGM